PQAAIGTQDASRHSAATQCKGTGYGAYRTDLGPRSRTDRSGRRVVRTRNPAKCFAVRAELRDLSQVARTTNAAIAPTNNAIEPNSTTKSSTCPKSRSTS